MAETETPAPSTYQILTSTDDGKTWGHIGAQEASNQTAALNAFFPNGFEEDVQYVAVAGHYWNPQALRVRRVLMGLAPLADAGTDDREAQPSLLDDQPDAPQLPIEEVPA